MICAPGLIAFFPCHGCRFPWGFGRTFGLAASARWSLRWNAQSV